MVFEPSDWIRMYQLHVVEFETIQSRWTWLSSSLGRWVDAQKTVDINALNKYTKPQNKCGTACADPNNFSRVWVGVRRLFEFAGGGIFLVILIYNVI